VGIDGGSQLGGGAKGKVKGRNGAGGLPAHKHLSAAVARSARYNGGGTLSGGSTAAAAAVHRSPKGKSKSNWGHSAGNSTESVAFAEVAAGVIR
jgi:hypothetical protein